MTKSRFRRNLISLILTFFLVLSLVLNIILLNKQKEEKVVIDAIKYLEGPELLAEELKDFYDKTIKKNEDLAKRILEVKRHRDSIDKHVFRSNDNIYLLRCPELSRFYALINDSDSLLINKMENLQDSLWGKTTTCYPLKKITDTLDLFIKQDQKQINGRPIPESNIKSETSISQQSEEKNSFWERLKSIKIKIFKKR